MDKSLDIRLNDKWRVSMIDHPPQWTLCRLAHHKGKEIWQPVSFCQTREALLRAIREKVVRGAEFYPGSENLAVSASEMAKLADFPARIDRRAD
jgi:hypothetical protein